MIDLQHRFQVSASCDNFTNKINLEIYKFPDGEIGVNIPLAAIFGKVDIVAYLTDSDSIITLIKIVDALRNQVSNLLIDAYIPFIPGARGDRIMVKGEAFNLKVNAALINLCNFNRVLCLDPHSDVTPALINNCTIITNHMLVKSALYIAGIQQDSVLVIPDAGASKKIKDLASTLSSAGVSGLSILKCDKTREVSTGKLTGFEVFKETLDPELEYVIVDDICDGGGTFLGLADEMKRKGAVKMHLIVSHGIFSKGFEELQKYFKTIHCFSTFLKKEDLPRGVYLHHDYRFTI